MRVLHFVKSFSPLSETFIYDYVTELERQGVDSHVVTFRRKKPEDRPFQKVHVVDRPNRWHPRRLWNRALVPFGIGEARTSDWPQTRGRLAAVVRHVDPDIVHAHFGPAGALIGPVARADDIPLVVSFHGFDAFKLPSEPFWSEKYTTLFEQAKCITVVSDVMAEHLAEIGAPSDKVTVVRVGKRVDEYPYHAPTSHVRNWISVGRLIEKKGFGDCIRAFQRLVADYPASTLDIIGAGPRYDSLQKEIESAGLTEHVRLLGNRPHSEVKQQMASADGFVLCSKEAGDGNREGVPTVLMEAQAVGLPVVSTTHSGIPEVIPESNRDYLASEGEIEEISDCLNRMAEQSVEELQITSERGRQKIEQDFNLFNEVGGLRHTYQTLNSRKQ